MGRHPVDVVGDQALDARRWIGSMPSVWYTVRIAPFALSVSLTPRDGMPVGLPETQRGGRSLAARERCGSRERRKDEQPAWAVGRTTGERFEELEVTAS